MPSSPLPPSAKESSKLPEQGYVDDGGVRELLEDFEAVGSSAYAVLTVRRPHLRQFRENLRAVVAAATLNLASVDYARRRYCKRAPDAAGLDARLEAYLAAYQSSKAYIGRMLAKLRTNDRPEPTAGIFSSSLVLERLRSSFFSAHFLYRMGHRYEGHAVSRLILEQIAWAYAAHGLDDVKALKRIRATDTVTQLKKFVPDAGRLYGLLSKETHIAFAHHPSFTTLDHGRTAIWYAQGQFLEYGRVILQLADMFGLVWELSQLTYIEAPETIQATSSEWCSRPDRPFVKEIQQRLAALENATAQAS